jgi:hypothetical protein
MHLKSCKSGNQCDMFSLFFLFTHGQCKRHVRHGCEVQLLRHTARNIPHHAHALPVAASAALLDD